MGNRIWEKFLELNEKQREQVSKLFDKLSVGSLLPVVLKLMSDGKSGDFLYIFFWLFCVIIFAVLSVATLATKDE